MKETNTYLGGIVDVNGWVDFATAIKSFADHRPIGSEANDTKDAVYLMLMGYVLEDLAKSIILCRTFEVEPHELTHFAKEITKLKFLFRDGKTKCDLKTHNLDMLYKAKYIGFDVSPIQITHLTAISRYTKWKGRYPVPLGINEVPSSEPNLMIWKIL